MYKGMVYGMSYRADEIRKRIAKRKRENHIRNSNDTIHPYFPGDEEKYGSSPFPKYNSHNHDELHPLFKKEIFIFKMLISVCLVLIIAILFKNQSAQFDASRNLVEKVMQNEFQFAAISSWYESKFGKPLTLFPDTHQKSNATQQEEQQYAVPAVGKVFESFEINGKGVMIETKNHTSVDAVKEGKVIYAGIKEDLGKTVIIQHPDSTETWYGNLQSISINLYDFVETGSEIGKVTDKEDKLKGYFYFAIKQGDKFIDPIQVVSFE